MKETENQKTGKTPITVKITQILILLVGIVWIVFSLYMTISPGPFFAKLGLYRWIVAGMTFIPGLVLLILGFLIRKQWKTAWYLTVIALAVMTIAIIFDQVGWVDISLMIGSAVPLVLLIVDRKWYLKVSV